jgi:hypothetical protein
MKTKCKTCPRLEPDFVICLSRWELKIKISVGVIKLLVFHFVPIPVLNIMTFDEVSRKEVHNYM